MNGTDNAAANEIAKAAAKTAVAPDASSEKQPAAADTTDQQTAPSPIVAQVPAAAPSTVVTETPVADAGKGSTATINPGDPQNVGSTVTGSTAAPTPNLTETLPTVKLVDPGTPNPAAAVTSDPAALPATQKKAVPDAAVPLPQVGDSVLYTVSDSDDQRLKAKGVSAGDHLAATIVRVWGPTSVNLNIIPDGGGAFFRANVIKGDAGGQWKPKVK